MANSEIESNNLERAIEILINGIKSYPQYAAAYLLLGKANILTGNYATALKYIKKGSDLIHSKKTYDYYFKELENIKKQRSLFQNSSRSSFLPETDLTGIPDEPELFEDKLNDTSSNDILRHFADHSDMNFRDRSLEKNSEAKADSYSDSLLGSFSGNNMIVSETLAKIYSTQGELREAIEIYKKLIKKNPEKEEYFSQKITELKSQLEL